MTFEDMMLSINSEKPQPFKFTIDDEVLEPNEWEMAIQYLGRADTFSILTSEDLEEFEVIRNYMNNAKDLTKVYSGDEGDVYFRDGYVGMLYLSGPVQAIIVATEHENVLTTGSVA